ncbi:MAG: RNA 2',3'-cyclic phosphodiesterase [Rhodocyclaceae bacterium]|nr:RNA 2',3'-cyclic phosphodiesterase [Rhodocyclaceae bacterium]
MPDTAPAGAKRRLFFALWPEAEVSRKLALLGRETQAGAGGRAMRRETLHLTLAFLGPVSQEMMDRAMAVAGAVRARAFDLVLDRLECWRHNHIVWAGASALPAEAGALAEGLTRELRSAGFSLERRPFAAHVTLLRNARCPETLTQPQPIFWPVRDFVLVESKLSPGGARYEVVGRWPLAL